jgi:hypothetical protein
MNNPYYNQPYYNYNQPYYPQQIRPRYMPLYYTNGIAGVQSIILDPNEKIYFLDSNSNTLFIKSSDAEGRYSIESYELTKTGTPKTDYVLQDDFKAFVQRFDETMNKLLEEVKNGRQ